MKEKSLGRTIKEPTKSQHPCKQEVKSSGELCSYQKKKPNKVCLNKMKNWA